MAMTLPQGFEPHFRQSPLTDPWEPLYSTVWDDGVTIGLQIGDSHTNSRGFAHGGLIAALADNAMGLACVQGSKGQLESAVTVGLSIDYLAVAGIGDWLEFRAKIIKVGRTLSFAECRVVSQERLIARATANFASGRK